MQATLQVKRFNPDSDRPEPYYQDYVQTDLTGPLREAGFGVESVETHYVSKVIVARR